MLTIAEKGISFARDRRNWLARMNIKLDSLRDRFTGSTFALDHIFCHDAVGRGLSTLFGADASSVEPLTELERHLAQRHEVIQRRAKPGVAHNGTTTLGRLCHIVCRALRPHTVVETGVAYGVTSAYILHALGRNKAGTLHSIDLPPLARDGKSWVGYLVAPELRDRWDLRIGSARKLLPPLLAESAPEVFVHDSLHTYSHMKWEFESALSTLRPGGVLIADDIEGNRAFEEATRHPRVASWFAIRQEDKSAIAGAIRLKE